MTERIYSIAFTVDEVTRMEDALYTRADVLTAIATELRFRGEVDNANKVSSRAVFLENLAAKIGLQLDQDYLKTLNTNKEKTNV